MAMDTAEDKIPAVAGREPAGKVAHVLLVRGFEKEGFRLTPDLDAMDVENGSSKALQADIVGWKLEEEPVGGMVAVVVVEAD